MEYKLVKVEWEDSRQPISEWQFLEDLTLLDPVKCITVGYLIKDGETHVCICQSIGDHKEDMQVLGIITIPSSCISKITNLQEVK